MNLLIFSLLLFVLSFNKLHAKKIDYLKLQHAGEIGYAAIGLGKDVSDRYNMEFFYGNVPKSKGGINIDTVAMKNFWKFLKFEYANLFTQPYAGFNVYHVRGSHYQTSRNDAYPEDYYRIGSVRGMIFFGADFSHNKYLANHFYFESERL